MSLYGASVNPSSSQICTEITNTDASIWSNACLINILSNEGFRKMVSLMEKRYAIPSHIYFSKVEIPTLYAKIIGKKERGRTAETAFAKFYSYPSCK